MSNIPQLVNLELVYIIVNDGVARKIMKCGKQCGITGGTIFFATGTGQSNKWIDFFDFAESKKEVILMLMSSIVAEETLNTLNEKFKFHKPNHGIAFRMPITQVLGSSLYSNDKERRGAYNTMYQAIITIVERGQAEAVMESATSAGAKGGTIINARGSGMHETFKLFNMEISPEKEIVLILTESHLTDAITESIRSSLNIDDPGKGIIFVQEVTKTYGLY